MKKLLAVGLLGMAAAVSAETIDLATVGNLDVAALVDENEYVNSGDELRTITVTPAANVTNSCKISGKIRLIKKGTTKYSLSNSANDFSGGAQVVAGVLEALASNALGTGEIEVGSTTQISHVRFNAEEGVFPNDIHVLASSTTYPAIGLYNGSGTKSKKKGMQFNGNVTADGDLIFENTGDWVNKFFPGATDEDKSGYYSSCWNGSVAVANMMEIRCKNRHCFVGPVSAKLFRLTRDGDNTSAYRGAVHLYNAANRFGALATIYCWFYAEADNVFGGAILDWNWGTTSSAGEWYRGYHNNNGHAQTIAGFAGAVQPATPKRERNKVAGNGAWTVTGTVDKVEMTSDVYFNANSNPLIIDAPDQTVTFHAAGTYRAAQMSGAITVNNGKMRVTGVQSFMKVPSVTVGAGAEFSLESATNNALKAVTAITVGAGGKFTIGDDATAPFVSKDLVVRLASDSTFTVPAGESIAVKEIYVDGERKNGGLYASPESAAALGAKPLACLAGDGLLSVDAYSGATTYATWTNGAGTKAMKNGNNWDPVNPDLMEGSLVATFAAAGAGDTVELDSRVDLKGMVFDLQDAQSAFAFEKTGENALLAIGEKGAVFAESATPCDITFGPKVFVGASELWSIGAGGKNLTFENGFSSQGSSVVFALAATNRVGVTLKGDSTDFVGTLRSTNVMFTVDTASEYPFGTVRPEIYIGSPFGNSTNQPAVKIVGKGVTVAPEIRVLTESPSATVPLLVEAGTTNLFKSAFMTYAAGTSSTGGRVNRTVRYHFCTNSYTRFNKAMGSDWTPMYYDGAGTVEFDAILSSGSHVYIGDDGAGITAIFHASGNQGYDFTVGAKATAITLADNAFRPSGFDTRRVWVRGTVLAGTTKHEIWHLSGAGRFVGEAGSRVAIKYTCTNTTDYAQNPTDTCGVMFGGAIDVGLSQGRYTLSAVSDTTGELFVTNGLLTLSSTAMLTNVSAVAVAETGALVVSNGEQLNPKADWRLSGTVKLTGRAKAASLVLGDADAPAEPGVYGSVEAAASRPGIHVDSHFTGPGVLRVGNLGLTLIVR